MTADQQEAQGIAGQILYRFNVQGENDQEYCNIRDEIAATLLEARADGIEDTAGISPRSAQEEYRRLRAEAQALRERT